MYNQKSGRLNYWGNEVQVETTSDDSAAQGVFRPPPPKKNSLSFILNEESDPNHDGYTHYASNELYHSRIRDHTDHSQVKPRSITAVVQSLESSNLDEEDAKKKKRKARICKTEGCNKYVVDRGLCIRHGGGKRCYIEGCSCRAQNRGLCWKHGGFTQCTVEGCAKRAKSRGICWSHGGGTRCKHEACTKIAVSHGLCWAHGGGKRCVIEGCKKPAYERNGNMCAEHFDPTLLSATNQSTPTS